MRHLNFQVNSETIRLINELKKTFEVDSNAAVIRRALALAKVCAEHRRDDATITMLGKEERVIVLNL